MARPQKTGLEYFPLDVDIDQDDKIAIIEAQHGVLGFGIVIKLLMKIYSEGYWYKWSEKEQLLFSKRVNVNINEVNVIINDCIKWGLFDSSLFKKHEILTSKGIQTRYLEATRRRKTVDVIKEYLLLKNGSLKTYTNLVIVDINEVNVNINTLTSGVNDNIGTQSKVKKSKEENSKVIEEKKKQPNHKQIVEDYTTDETLKIALLDFVEMRKKNKAPFTLKALDLILKNLDKLSNDDKTKTEIVNQSVMNGWKGLFPLNNLKNETKTRNQKSDDVIREWVNEQTNC